MEKTYKIKRKSTGKEYNIKRIDRLSPHNFMVEKEEENSYHKSVFKRMAQKRKEKRERS